MKVVRELIPYVVIVLIVVLVRSFIITPVRVNGSSMESTLQDGNILLLEKYDKNYKRFDIVVAEYAGEKLIKRVIGLPGDTVEYRSNILYINGERISEPFINEDTEDFSLRQLGYDKIPEGHYFIVGDNRDDSLDSRYLGLFKKESIEGKVIFRIFPFNKFGKIK